MVLRVAFTIITGSIFGGIMAAIMPRRKPSARAANAWRKRPPNDTPGGLLSLARS
jgi:hypothetical protein